MLYKATNKTNFKNFFTMLAHRGICKAVQVAAGYAHTAMVDIPIDTFMPSEFQFIANRNT